MSGFSLVFGIWVGFCIGILAMLWFGIGTYKQFLVFGLIQVFILAVMDCFGARTDE